MTQLHPQRPMAAPLLRLVLVISLCTPLAHAHGGEDHGDAPVVAATPAEQAPRAATQTEAFELVAVLSSTSLTLFLDSYGSNQPVEGATVELESGTFKAVAQTQGPGVYTVPAAPFLAPGRYPLTITVQTATGSDLLDATLVNDPQPAASALTSSAHTAPGTGLSPWALLLGGSLLATVAGGIGWTLGRRRSSARPMAQGASS